MKELDVLLSNYLEHEYAAAPPREQASFRQLLELQDPELYGYCLGSTPAPSDLVFLIERITGLPKPR